MRKPTNYTFCGFFWTCLCVLRIPGGDWSFHVSWSKRPYHQRLALTIPKGELASGSLACDFGCMLRLIFEVQEDAVFYWLDCKPALHWIKAPGKDLEATVARAAARIRERTNPLQWNHVPTELNPADLPSRGISASKLRESDLWWHGPEFLLTQEWPMQNIPTEPTVVLPGEDELGRIVCTAHLQERNPFLNAASFGQGLRVVQVLLSRMRKDSVRPQEAFKAWRIFDQRLWFAKELGKLKHCASLNYSGVLLTMQQGELCMTGRVRSTPRPLLHKTLGFHFSGSPTAMNRNSDI